MKKYNLNGFEIWEADEVQSTNTLAVELPRAELQDKSVVLTWRQTQGRGQAGNSWESEPEKNISMTVVFKPSRFPAGQQFAVSMIIALACRDFVSRYTAGCEIKWPNDIYVNDRKIAGILIEHVIAGAYVGCSFCGIGLNINQREFFSDAPNPVSLLQLTGSEIPLSEALAGLLECIACRYDQLLDYSALETDFYRHLYRREGVHSWRDDASEFRAVISGVDEFGRLVLTDDTGKKRVYGFKEVQFL